MVHEIHEDKWINIKYIYSSSVGICQIKNSFLFKLNILQCRIWSPNPPPSQQNWKFVYIDTFQRISLYLITNFSHFHSFCSIWSSIVYSLNSRLSYSCMHTSITRNDHSFFVFFFSHKENNHFGEWKIYMVP